MKSWVFRDFGVFRFLLRGFQFGEKDKKEVKRTREWGFLFFLGLASNVVAFVIECCDIEVSDFKQMSSKHSNAAALGTQCYGIGHTRSEERRVGKEC